MTNEYNCTKIVATCIRIMLAILKEHPSASFGFLGSNTIDQSNGVFENKTNTKRFRVYRIALENLIGQQTFQHVMNKEHSTYLMVNNRNKSISKIIDHSKLMFETLYPELED